MEPFIYISLAILFLLGIFDIFVGVGNDAVNFMNSAIGAKVAKFKTILWIATIGVLFGAISSAGMMEIARMGIFNPQYFTFEDVLVIFLAVMLTDIVLLDAFNTFGYPTSTTVSLIFELLGASIIVAGFSILKDNLPMSYLFNIDDTSKNVIGFLNWSKTKVIISGIFLSVLISFSVGALVMWFSRILFSYQYERRLRLTGVIWSSIAMLAMGYFLIYKGLKSTYSTIKVTQTEIVNYNKALNPNAPDTLGLADVIHVKKESGETIPFTFKEVDKETNERIYQVFFGSKEIKNIIDYVQDHLLVFLVLLFLISVLFFTIYERMGGNPLKIVVLSGLFSLAMAFAGNDLVNFIGVPFGGFQAFDLYSSANQISGGNILPSEYLMTGLKFPLQTPHLYLFFAGIFMVLALWFSKKINTVIETEVKLSSQEEIPEKFKSNLFSRGIVEFSVRVNSLFVRFVPGFLQTRINKQFSPQKVSTEKEGAAFDMVRASVNMAVASMLIAIGTSMKLPLSTTYVTFMVAMGTSLADKAWGRESAVYRVAGVLHVIGGWFTTAFIAFFTSALIALVLINFKLVGLSFIVIIIIGLILYSNYIHKRNRVKKLRTEEVTNSIDLSTDRAIVKTAQKLSSSLINISDAYTLTIDGVLSENKEKIKNAREIFENLKTYYSDIKNNLFRAVKKSELNERQTAQLYILSNDMMQDMLQSLELIISSCDNHVKNSHKPLTDIQAESIRKIETEVNLYLRKVSDYLESHEFGTLNEFKNVKRSIFDHIESSLSRQVEGVYHKSYGFKNTDLMMSLLLETKDLIAISVRFSKLVNRLSKGESPLGNR